MRKWSFLAAALIAATGMADEFSSDEARAVMAYWNEPGRYEMRVPADAPRQGLWRVRLTVAGSTWLWGYNRARNIPKGPPSQNAAPQNPEQVEWEKWIDAKVAFDRFEAQQQANALNAAIFKGFVGPAPAKATDPGPAPAGLVKLAGNPPRFAEAVTPLEHRIRFEDMELAYLDNVDMRPRFAFYRFERGVQSVGERVRELPKDRLDKTFSAAGLDASTQRIMAAVSLLEGGFDAVNTYDTGFVSVGLIQFASLRDGAGSLGRMLARYQASDPDDFQAHFRRFGVDATPDGKLAVIDPDTGAEAIGPDANRRIIEDKRLIAVFQRAGRLSEAFRVAQVKSAATDYLPTGDVLNIQLAGAPVAIRVGDIIRSEAGIATLMDRKVNTGSLDPLPFVLALIAGENGLSKASDFVRFERDIVIAMRFRKDYLQDTNLSQPGPAAKPNRNYSQASRSGNRSGRSGSTPSRSGGRRGG